MGLEKRSHEFADRKLGFPGIPRVLGGLLLCASLLGLGSHDAPSVSFVLTGPNDGEPINSRVKLSLRTNYTEKGNIVVSLNDRRLFERPLFQGGIRDQDKFVTYIELDVAQAGRFLGKDFLHPDAGPVRITVQLYSPQGKFVASFAWSGFVGKPWIEILPMDPTSLRVVDGANDPEPVNPGSPPPTPAAPRLLLHPMSDDLFFLVVAARTREPLRTTPADSSLLREGRLLETGAFTQLRDGTFARTAINLNDLRRFDWTQSYVVLWTYDSRGNWKRSVVSPLAARP